MLQRRASSEVKLSVIKVREDISVQNTKQPFKLAVIYVTSSKLGRGKWEWGERMGWRMEKRVCMP